MIVLWIVLAILALPILVILLGSVRVRIVYREKVKVQVGTCGINITVVSDKEKKEKKPKRLEKCKNPEKVLQRELKKQQKAAEKAAKKAALKRQKAKAKKELKKQKKEQQKAQAQEQPKGPKPNFKENVEMIIALLKKLYRVTKGAFHFHFRRMHVAVGTGDAAKTAVTYGVIVQSASYLLNFIESTFSHLKRRYGDMTIYPDYTASKTTVDIDIVCKIKIRKLISIGVGMALAFLKERSRAKKKAIVRERKKAEEAALNTETN